MMIRPMLIAAGALLLTCPVWGAEREKLPVSNVAGKKLIRVSQALINHTAAADVPDKVKAWQATGYDGVCLSVWADLESSEQRLDMQWKWWDVDPRKRSEFDRDVAAFKSVKDWGRLTDNFLWIASHVEGRKPPDWFNDEDWQVVTANARLAARLAKEIGFRGILFDQEGYGMATFGVWRQPWDYPLYATSDYTFEKRKEPRPFEEVAAKVRQRGRQWARAISAEYPDVVLAAIGLYENAWGGLANNPAYGGDLAKSPVALWPAFVDGLVEGLDERATLVSFCGGTYLDSQYRDMLIYRDIARQQSLMVSAIPDLARRRVSFAAGIWTDAGFGLPRFSNTDARMNQRDPKRHMHAVHNALAASDRYAWQWGEWGKQGESNFMTTEPTPLMREYWKANIDGHRPRDLAWRPMPHQDQTDYAQVTAAAVAKEKAFWQRLTEQGYTVAKTLPEDWKFRLDLEMHVRWRNFMKPEFDDGPWFTIKSTRCWQMQGFAANEIGLYRAWFDAPADLDPQKQEIMLAFGGLGSGQGHVHINGGWISSAKLTVDVSQSIKPGEANLVSLYLINRSGPGGLMGQVKLLVRDRK